MSDAGPAFPPRYRTSPYPRATDAFAPARVLDQMSGQENLVVVHAGRFGGATTLLRSWLDTRSPDGHVVAHLIGPDPAAGEAHYWSCVHEALVAAASARPALPSLSGRGGAADSPGDPDAAFGLVLDALRHGTRPLTLLLDDLHLLSDPVGRTGDLLAAAPAGGLRILGTTRAAAPWAARGAGVPGQKVITAPEVVFEPTEVAGLLDATRSAIDRRSTEIIHQLTEGLPGLVAAVCASVPGSALAAPTHLDEHVEAVIHHEVRRALDTAFGPGPARRSLALSAAASPLTAASAAPLVDDPGAFLSLLDASGFAHPTGSPRDPEWRFPRPVRSSLLRTCREEAPTELHDYRLELVRHLLDSDSPAHALTVAGDLEDWPLVVRIARENLHVLYTRHYAVTMTDEVLARVPAHLLADEPDLERLRRVHHTFSGPPDVTSRDGLPAPLPPDGQATTGDEDGQTREWTTTIIRALELRIEGDYAGAVRLCDDLVSRPTPEAETIPEANRDPLGFAYTHIGISYIMTGRFTDAIAALRRAPRVTTESLVHRDVAGKLALVHTVLGDLHDARENLTEERRHPALPAATEILVRPAGDAAAALLALERFDLDTASGVLGDLGPPGDHEEFWGFVLYAWGQFHLAAGTPGQGLRFLDAHQPRFAPLHTDGAVVVPLLQAVRADLHLACHQPDEAAAALSGSVHPLTSAARARLLLLTDDPRSALDLACEALRDPASTTRVSLELELVAAAASLATGDVPRARHHASAAVLTHRVSGLDAPFRTLPAAVGDRLGSLAPDLPTPPRATGPGFGTLTFHADWQFMTSEEPLPRPVEARLTKREREVLLELATDASVKQIAARGYVSPNTIKSQIRAVYRKLGVSTREAAVAKARSLDLF